MGKRKSRSKKSITKLPKGLPVRKGTAAETTGNATSNSNNPFEYAQKQKRPKFVVHNRSTSAPPKKPSALAEALKHRQKALKDAIQSKKKANVFQDKRLGEYNQQMTIEEQNLARLVKERTRQSKRVSKFALQDDDDDEDAVLTHRGKSIDNLTAADHVILSDDDDDNDDDGNLDAIDTSLHFGGLKDQSTSIYGSGDNNVDMKTMYAQKKNDLDELILRRKVLKAEKQKSKEEQVDKFVQMDESFAELSKLLLYRDKEKDIREHIQAKRDGKLSIEDQDFDNWDKEMKQYMYTQRKVKATDRTKSHEEIAKEEAERLHELEKRRIARMNNDFDDDNFSDINDDDDVINNRKKKRRKKQQNNNPETLDNDSDSDDDKSVDKLQTRFTADGLVKIDKNGNIVCKVGEEDKDDGKKSQQEQTIIYKVGTKVIACYRATEQYDNNVSWFNGTISNVKIDKKKDVVLYDIDYDDGDYEENVQTQHIKPIEKTEEELEKETEMKNKEITLKRIKQKAKEKARTEIPYVFDVPTTIEALNDLIITHAITGTDASLIIQRIYKANSVRLDKRNVEKMQNFYDVLIKRFIAIGDAIYKSGNGGTEIGRYEQLDVIIQVLYSMAQDSPDSSGAVWCRRLGIFHSAHAKRLRDAALVHDDDEETFTAWPSTGVILALRVIGHIFPVTDKRHYIVTPTILFLGQILCQTPILSLSDIVMGMVCTGILIEYTKDAKRVAPEAHAYIASIIRLYSIYDSAAKECPLPTLSAVATELTPITNLRTDIAHCETFNLAPQLSLELDDIRSKNMPASILFAALHLAEVSAKNLAGHVSTAETEVFAEIADSILTLNPKHKKYPLPELLQSKVKSVASVLSDIMKSTNRAPICRRSVTQHTTMIKTLAPRLENVEKYSMSKDKGKNATQAAADRTRREYKREHKAAARELRLDGALIEQQRRQEQAKKDEAAKKKRQRAFAWLEGEQATMNQQVRQGGGLLQGGGTGAAKKKAASGKLGIKKGGKF